MKQSGKEKRETEASQQGEGNAVVEWLAWQTATRDDKRVAQAIHSGQEIDAMYELSGARLLDEWFAFPEIPLLLFLC